MNVTHRSTGEPAVRRGLQEGVARCEGLQREEFHLRSAALITLVHRPPRAVQFSQSTSSIVPMSKNENDDDDDLPDSMMTVPFVPDTMMVMMMH